MKVCIAGSREIEDYDLLCKVIADSNTTITEIVSGTARGADRLGERFALEHDILLKKFPANWNKFGKRAGYLRNKEMADYANFFIILWDGESKGTKHMIDLVYKTGKNLILKVVEWKK